LKQIGCNGFILIAKPGNIRLRSLLAAKQADTNSAGHPCPEKVRSEDAYDEEGEGFVDPKIIRNITRGTFL
jgi:hypothetical protein